MSDFNDRLGPFYTVESVAALRNCDEVDVRRDIDRGILLGIVMADRVIALPTRQFNDAAEALPGLASVSEVVGTGDPTAIALFLFTKSEPFDGRTAADWLRARRAYGPLRN